MGIAQTKVKSFEDMRVFQEARELVNRVYALTRTGPISRDRELVDQMRRAAVSILSNIAEGFERETDNEFIRALYIAKGSCGELRAQVFVSGDQKYLTPESCQDILVTCRTVSSRLAKLIAYFKQTARPARR